MLDRPLSASMIRASYSVASAPSVADDLPSIDFGFSDLRDRMSRFTHKFDEFIALGRKRVLEERNEFRRTIAELHGWFLFPYTTKTNEPPQLTIRSRSQRTKK